MSEYNINNTKFLKDIDYPKDLKKLNLMNLRELADEVREYLIDTISRIGGHLGASLGVCELTLALHYVFNTPDDKIIWDVGHQGYIHKILTGRKEQLKKIRQKDGISGFLKRSESEYDVFGAGHATTSISAALGIATARDFSKKNFKVISVIGDGSMTGGMAYEAMNNIGLLKKDIIVVLNDNRMSIAPNVWSLQNYFNDLMTNDTYNKFRSKVWELTEVFDKKNSDRLRKVGAKIEGSIKSVITPGMLFEALGFRYFGPVNGHNVVNLVKMLEELKRMSGPILLHIISEKGKGPSYATDHPQKIHALNPFDKSTGIEHKKSTVSTYTKEFGIALTELAKNDPKIIAVNAAMPDGTGLNYMQSEIPDRYFDVGIAEQHAVTFCAGLATEGYTPVAAIYSTFLQRAFDQIIHDVAIQKLPVIFILDRGGLVGADGPTHHGVFDLTYLRLIPGMVLMSPKDENELRNMLFTATRYKRGPIAIRYPRGNALGVEKGKFELMEIGKGEIVKKGKDIAILAVGNMVKNSMDSEKYLSEYGISAEIINARFIKPLDRELLYDVFRRFDKIMTIEDNTIVGGFGSAVSEFASENNLKNDILIHGIPDRFIEHGKPEELHEELRIDAKGIAEVVREFLIKTKINEKV
ncbi:MAG TPA: 1-deoxy-D-xylulose-5-phosphate synthase [Ignavibacteria bacterium]|mgnify:CR=1 FL=1|nr:1-deoxy-D-xylulose-5-phosphate synthase [Bacteroidota bacterium]HRI83978.1 1-deoxy-D-xylulose-5-phosphate synthase [Ignavibacteria bacterium]HRJ99175.1 1-deoxy-D-xylulose-5-phosphate synthase [Ignavibacteria bacterium]